MTERGLSEGALRDVLVAKGRSLYWRGLTPGSSGNLSVRSGDGWLVTRTGCCLGTLQPDDLCWVDNAGRPVDGGAPTKEVPLHLRMYELHPALGAVVHLHSPHAVAVSILADVDPDDALPALTPYHVMRVGRLPLVPYARPGSTELAGLLARHLGQARCALLANHGSLAGGADLEAAADAAEEIEQTARLWLLTSGLAIRTLSGDAVAELSPTASRNSHDRPAV